MVIPQHCRLKFSHKETLWQTLFDWNCILFKNCFLCHPLGHLEVMYALRLWLVGKPVVVIELFSLSFTIETCGSGNLSKSVFFEGGGSFSAQFQTEGGIAPNHCWCQKKIVCARQRWRQELSFGGDGPGGLGDGTPPVVFRCKTPLCSLGRKSPRSRNSL